MIQRLIQTFLLAGLAGLGLLACAAPPQPPIGSEAPAIEASTWYNHDGPAPSLATLQGKAVLLEFWATW